MVFVTHLMDLVLEAAPWLLVGLLAAGLVKAWVPEVLVIRYLGGTGFGPVVRGALVGAPLPLCSCGVIPMAVGLRRQGASSPATVSFLIATPETGVDSIALSWAMLGPFMTVARPLAAIVSAILTGMATLLAERKPVFSFSNSADATLRKAIPVAAIPVAGVTTLRPTPSVAGRGSAESGCAGAGCGCGEGNPDEAPPRGAVSGFWDNSLKGIAYALGPLWDDIALWLLGGLVLAAAAVAWAPPGAMADYAGLGALSMLIMVLASIPVYVCATASTPLAAAMLFAGLSPGMALAFLIAGPATNMATLAMVGRELGRRVFAIYLGGLVTCAMGLGLLADLVVETWGLSTTPLHAGEDGWMPEWLAALSALLLIAFALRRPLALLVDRLSAREGDPRGS